MNTWTWVVDTLHYRFSEAYFIKGLLLCQVLFCGGLTKNRHIHSPLSSYSVTLLSDVPSFLCFLIVKFSSAVWILLHVLKIRFQSLINWKYIFRSFFFLREIKEKCATPKNWATLYLILDFVMCLANIKYLFWWTFERNFLITIWQSLTNLSQIQSHVHLLIKFFQERGTNLWTIHHHNKFNFIFCLYFNDRPNT